MAELPDSVLGEPCAYFWKDVIALGRYVHPREQYALEVDGARLERWARTGKAMIEAGVRVPINCDHSEKARDAVGQCLDFKVDGERLTALCQLVGDEGRKLAAKNDVSAGIDLDCVDGSGRKWGEAIVHVALTPAAVVGGQGGFVAALSAGEGGERVMLSRHVERRVTLTCAQAARLRAALGGEVDDGDWVERAIAELEGAKARRVELSAALERSAVSERRLAEVLEKAPASMDARSAAAMAKAAGVCAEACVARGAITPAVRDRLLAKLVGTGGSRAGVIALSKHAEGSSESAAGEEDGGLALAVFEALAANAPVGLGEKTGIQALGRYVPGEEDRARALREAMIGMASGQSR